MEFIVVYFVIHNERRRRDQDHPMIILVYLISTDLRFSSIDQEYSFTSSTTDTVFYYCRINTTFSTISNIRFHVITNLIIFYMGLSLFLNQNPLLQIPCDFILNYNRIGVMIDFYTCHLVEDDFILIENSGLAVLPLATDAIF